MENMQFHTTIFAFFNLVAIIWIFITYFVGKINDIQTQVQIYYKLSAKLKCIYYCILQLFYNDKAVMQRRENPNHR